MFNFVKLPNKLFYTSKNDEEEAVSILKSTSDDKTLLVLEFLYNNVNRRDIIKFTLEDIIKECGYIPNKNKNKTNDQFKNILVKLRDLKVINIKYDYEPDDKKFKDLDKYTPKDLIKCTLDINLDSCFVILEDFEKEKIITYNKEKVNNLKLLIYYYYLKSRMYKRSKEQGDLVAMGGRAETCNPSYKLISEDLGLTDETIKKYNDILVSLDMIRIGSAGNWYYNDDPMKFIRESSNIYSLYLGDEETTQNNLKEGIKLWKSLERNSNKVFTNSKQYKNNNRQLNGELGSIVKKIKNGTATEEDIKRRDEIKGTITPDDNKYKLSAILDSHKGELLSDIYYNEYCQEEVADKYELLEKDLGLLDNEDKLTVDWDYYKWVITNYKENQHQYYVNCVAKKIKEIELINKIERKTHFGKSKPKAFKCNTYENNDEELGGEDIDLSGFTYEEDLIQEEMHNNHLNSDVFSDYLNDEIARNRDIF